jgi:hypothetical protein
MKALVIYESMYGNTHVVADRIADGLRTSMEVTVLPADEAPVEVQGAVNLVVVGGPTHVHGVSRSSTRKAAIDAATKDPELTLDPDAEGPGLREWFDGLTPDAGDGVHAAAFDTRIDAAPMLTGRASKGIARRLRGQGFLLEEQPVSFLVDKGNHLLGPEAERARQWGATLGADMTAHYADRSWNR